MGVAAPYLHLHSSRDLHGAMVYHKEVIFIGSFQVLFELTLEAVRVSNCERGARFQDSDLAFMFRIHSCVIIVTPPEDRKSLVWDLLNPPIAESLP